MKKGFTLVELLAVIVVLAIILVIAIPNVMKVIEKTKIDVYIKNEKMMVSAAKKYLVNNSNMIPINISDTTEITLDDLKSNKLIDDIIDPKNKSSCSGYVLITKIKQDQYDYVPYMECGNNYFSDKLIDSDLILDLPLGDYKNDNMYLDKSGNENHGIDYGTSFAPNRFEQENKASSFNGESSYISLTNPRLLPNMSKFTMTAWVKTTNAGHGRIITLHAGSSNGSTVSIMENAGKFQLYLNSEGKYINTGYSINNGEWKFVALTYDGTTYKSYVDGKLIHSIVSGYGNLGSYNRNIGTYNGTYTFNGLIDDIRIYGRGLSNKEIEHNYRIGLKISE